MKELGEFLGLTGYYRNHINHLLTLLIQYYTCLEKMCNIHHGFISKSLYRTQELLQETQILIYPDHNKLYYVFIHASKYCCDATLCQHTLDSDILMTLNPSHSISGKFWIPTLIYAAFVKEAFAIYIYQKTQLLPSRC